MGSRHFVGTLDVGSVVVSDSFSVDGCEWGICLVADEEFAAERIDIDATLNSKGDRDAFLSQLAGWLDQLYCASTPQSVPQRAVDIGTIQAGPTDAKIHSLQCTELQAVSVKRSVKKYRVEGIEVFYAVGNGV